VHLRPRGEAYQRGVAEYLGRDARAALDLRLHGLPVAFEPVDAIDAPFGVSLLNAARRAPEDDAATALDVLERRAARLDSEQAG
jgi:hypothetical protein